MTELRDILTLAEASQEFGKAEVTLRRAAGIGALRARKVGRPKYQVWITTRQAVTDYLGATVVTPARDPRTGRWIHGPLTGPYRKRPKGQLTKRRERRLALEHARSTPPPGPT